MTAAITDFTQFAGLKAAANDRDPAVLDEVASQFEALFIQSMLKNMRASSLADPIFGSSDQHDMYQEMMDQQLALEMARGPGIGIGEMLVRQLGGESRSAGIGTKPVNLALPVRATANTRNSGWSDPGDFVEAVWPHAKRAASRLNVSPRAIVAQAALETGWGAHVMPRDDGQPSYNLFGIKAGNGWAGDSVNRRTIEFAHGIPQTTTARFRAYTNVAATFDDYSAFLGDNPRYAAAHGHGEDVASFADALQSAGYATDPQYASKLKSVYAGDTMQQALRALKIDDDSSIPYVPVSDSTPE